MSRYMDLLVVLTKFNILSNVGMVWFFICPTSSGVSTKSNGSSWNEQYMN